MKDDGTGDEIEFRPGEKKDRFFMRNEAREHQSKLPKKSRNKDKSVKERKLEFRQQDCFFAALDGPKKETISADLFCS